MLAFDPVQVFSGHTRAEEAPTPSAEALRDYIVKGAQFLLPQHDWRLLAEDEDTAEFSHGRLAAELQWLLFEHRDGGWKFSSYSSDCEPTSIVKGRPAISWNLARAQRRLRPSSRTVLVELGGGPCSGGRSLNEHAHPVFSQIGRKLLLSFWLDPVGSGSHTCEGLIEPPLRVRLPGRLGKRVLYEAGHFLPRRAGKTRLP